MSSTRTLSSKAGGSPATSGKLFSADFRLGAVAYAVTLTKLLHGLLATLPCLVTLMVLKGTHEEARYLLHPRLMAMLFGAITVLVFQSFGIYSEEIFSKRLLVRKTFFALSATFGLVLVAQNLTLNAFPIPGQYLVAWFAATVLLFLLARAAILGVNDHFMARGKYLQRAVIYGCNENGLRVAEHIEQNEDIRAGVVGFIDDEPSHAALLDNQALNLIGDTDRLEGMVRDERVEQVIVALPASEEERIKEVVDRFKRMPVDVLLAPDLGSFHHAQPRISQVAELPMANLSQRPLQGWSPLLKRAEDIVLSALCLLLLAPVMIAVAIAIKLESPGPVLFRQKRYGYNEHLIEVFKFRSMYHHLRDANAAQQTTRDDARITKVGRFIRKTSLDELPQLFNVFLGSMSMVGPRPHASATKAANVLFEDAVAEYAARHRVKPGITGLAQVNGYRGETDTLHKIHRRVEYDLEYIERWSVWLDLYILVRTIPAIVSARAAY